MKREKALVMLEGLTYLLLGFVGVVIVDFVKWLKK